MPLKPEQDIELTRRLFMYAQEYINDNVHVGGRIHDKIEFLTKNGDKTWPYLPEVGAFAVELARKHFKDGISEDEKRQGKLVLVNRALIDSRIGSLKVAKEYLVPKPSDINIDIPTMKPQFAANKFFVRDDGTSYDVVGTDYSYIRPLCSGIDQAVREIAVKTGHDVMMNDSLSPTDDARQRVMVEKFHKYSKDGIKMAVIGMIMTPDEAVANKGSYPADEDPVKSAQSFARNFNFFTKIMDDMIIYNGKNECLFNMRDKEIISYDRIKLTEALKANGFEPQVKIGPTSGLTAGFGK